MVAQEIARIAEWGEEQIVKYKERVTGEGRQRDIDRGKPKSQVCSLPVFIFRFSYHVSGYKDLKQNL